MQPVRFNGMTNIYTAPEGHNAERDGEIFDLPVMDDGVTMTSVWKPSEEELDILVNGGGFSLSILGRAQPPVMLGVVELDLPPVPRP